MDSFFRVCAGVLVAVVLCLSLHKTGKDITLLLSIAVCCMVLTLTLTYLEPVMAFLRQLQSMGSLDNNILKIMFKAIGIGLLAEICCLICADSGNAAMGKAVQIMAAAVILWLCLPLMTSLLELLQSILGGL